ncbi:MAG: endolytic transglycosylase MltG [Patescibacteria group bacterium]|nr:endolytic transglycosylase MltG [Patescibacteria group bacterium]
MKKSLKLIIGTILAIIGGTLITMIYLFNDYSKCIDTPASDSTEKVEFIIEEGETTTEIALSLKQADLIQNELYFRIYIRKQGISTKLQAGTFQIPKNLTLKQICETLQLGTHPDIWVTIPEGLMTTEIADIIQQEFQENTENSFSKDEFLSISLDPTMLQDMDIPIPAGKPIEGYLFPDTYRFPSDATAEYVIAAILSNFATKIYDVHYKSVEESGLTLYEVLILASIIERETKFSDDRPVVADIMHRRLNENWALEVDATLLYHFQDWEHEISSEDLQLDSLYNTRKYPELPPTPISNPGEETIRAILAPESNSYWFYVSDSDGDLHYAETMGEHEENISKYIYQQQ